MIGYMRIAVIGGTGLLGGAVVRALGIRLDLVSPGWTSETLALLGMDPATGTPAARVAQTYVDLVQGSANGDNIVPRQQI